MMHPFPRGLGLAICQLIIGVLLTGASCDWRDTRAINSTPFSGNRDMNLALSATNGTGIQDAARLTARLEALGIHVEPDTLEPNRIILHLDDIEGLGFVFDHLLVPGRFNISAAGEEPGAPLVTSEQVQRATVEMDPVTRQPVLQLSLLPEAAERLSSHCAEGPASFTIALDDRVISTATMAAPLPGTEVVFTLTPNPSASDPVRDAQIIAAIIQGGPLQGIWRQGDQPPHVPRLPDNGQTPLGVPHGPVPSTQIHHVGHEHRPGAAAGPRPCRPLHRRQRPRPLPGRDGILLRDGFLRG